MMKFIVIISSVLVAIIYLMFYYPSYEITKQIPAVCTGKWMDTHRNHPIQLITGFRAPNNQILEFHNSDCFLNENVRSGDTYLLDVNICVRGNRVSYHVSNIHNLCS